MAAIPARWVKLAVHELEFTMSLVTASASQAGITSYPIRQLIASSCTKLRQC